MIEPKHWQAIDGEFSFAPHEVVFKGGVVPTEITSEPPRAMVGLAMSSTRFSGGSIDTTFDWHGVTSFPSVEVVLYRNTVDDSTISVGIQGSTVGERTTSRFAVQLFDAGRSKGGMQTLASTARVTRADTGQMSLRVVQVGSVIDLYADDVHVIRHLLSFTPPVSQCGLLLIASGTVHVSEYRVITHKQSAFVVMQFGVPYDQLYADVIRPVVAGCGFDVIRADDDFGPGLIIADVVRRIQEAEVIIADITPENQNVFYEVGYAHALGKPTILLAEKGKRLPFDVSGFRTLFYENTIAGKAAVEQGLRRHVEAITRERPVSLAV